MNKQEGCLSLAYCPSSLFQVVFLHPVHNYALISYDPSALGPVGGSVVRAAELLPGGFQHVIAKFLLF